MSETLPGPVILQAVMGSHAYGMATASSDQDRKGIYVTPMADLTSLHPPGDTVVRTDPDFEYHEVGKFLRLALSCNPTVTEQLWLEPEDYEVLTWHGVFLRRNRDRFLSRKRVLGAFGGYAMDQLKRMQSQGDGSYSSDVRNRKQKHTRHMVRLMRQGRSLLETGTLTVKVADPEELFEIGRLSDEEIALVFEHEDKLLKTAYDNSDLQEAADIEAADSVLRIIRSDDVTKAALNG